MAERISPGGAERDNISDKTLFEKYQFHVDDKTIERYRNLDKQEALAVRHLARLGASPKIPGVAWDVEERRLIVRKTPLIREALDDEEIREKALSIKKGEGGFSDIGLDFEFMNWYENSEHRLLFQIINLRKYSEHSQGDQDEIKKVGKQIGVLTDQITNPALALERRRKRLALAFGFDEKSELINGLFSND